MGLFSFLKGIGKKVGLGREAEEIEQDIREALGNSVEDLQVAFDDGEVTLRGKVKTQAAREKAILLAGNVESVKSVNDQMTMVREAEAAPASQARFYTIEKGDSLWKIAQQHYGDGNKWQRLFEANREVIKDPDLIYPGQQIRVPDID